MSKTYKPDFTPIISMYRDAFHKHGMSPSSVLMPKGRQDVRFQSLCQHMRPTGFSVLDYGSGLGDLVDYMRPRFSEFHYTGADIVEEFVTAASDAHPSDRFIKLNDFRELKDTFDYIVVAGVFNTLYSENNEIHKNYVFEVIEHLFSLAHDFLAVNFMTDAVDFRQQGAYHQNPHEFCAFANERLSRRWILDQSYMPYEFTLTIFRDSAIQRPENIYRTRA